MSQQTYLSRKRTLDEANNELKQLDPNTAFSKYYIRRLAISGAVPTIMCGRKRLIDLDALIEYLNTPHDIEFNTSNTFTNPLPDTDNRVKGIRRIV